MSQRDCGTCTLCCKVFDVPPVNKKQGVWCQHCAPGRGCGIHATRPQFCRDFHCLWIADQSFGPEWKPETSKFVLNLDQGGRRLAIVPDPGSPNAWKREPYGPRLREIAGEFLAQGRNVVVFDSIWKTLILPDGEVRLGKREERVRYEVRPEPAGAGVKYRVVFLETPEAAA